MDEIKARLDEFKRGVECTAVCAVIPDSAAVFTRLKSVTQDPAASYQILILQCLVANALARASVPKHGLVSASDFVPPEHGWVFKGEDNVGIEPQRDEKGGLIPATPEKLL